MSLFRRACALVFVLFAVGGLGAARAQDDQTTTVPTLDITRPVSHATVRETVPVKVASRDLPPDGYVSISIDGQFRTAKPLPKSGPVYVWDTKAPYTTANDPDTKKYVTDGDHTIRVAVFDSRNKLVGAAIVPVRVSNKIVIPPAQGVILKYRWPVGGQLRYSRQTTLAQVDANGNVTQTVQASQVRYTRSVESQSGRTYFVRDYVLPGGTITNGSQTQSVESAYNIKSKYRTVDDYGRVVESTLPLGSGDHFAFSIPVLPARRVGVGDSWQSAVQLTPEWASSAPKTVTAESRLESFEWQNGYPTAKIHETFDGSVQFSGSASGNARGASSAVSGGQVHYERIVYFAYNSGRLIRTETTIAITGADLGTGGGRSGGRFSTPSPMMTPGVPGMPGGGGDADQGGFPGTVPNPNGGSTSGSSGTGEPTRLRATEITDVLQ